eukprot:scaffold24803_cov20-Prasinocladus_malaysianus.AAC.1
MSVAKHCTHEIVGDYMCIGTYKVHQWRLTANNNCEHVSALETVILSSNSRSQPPGMSVEHVFARLASA